MNSSPLVHEDATTSDPRAADALLRRLYTRATLRVDPRRAPRFRYRQKVDGDNRMTFARLKSSDLLEFTNDLPHLTIAQLLDGDYTMAMRGEEPVVPLRPTLVPREVHIDGAAGRYDLFAVNLDPDTVETVVDVRPEVASLVRPGQGFRTSRTPAAERLWVSTVQHVGRNVISHPDAMSSDLVRSAAFRMLSVAAVEAFGDPVDEQRIRDEILPHTVRRARAFIDDNAHLPITVDDVARAGGMSTRGMQWAFRRHLDITPTEYLRKVRLEGARRDLLAADPDADTVEAIALRWGFAHTGRFAGYFQRAFRERPSATLRR